MILLMGKVMETLITAAPQPQTNSLKSLLLSDHDDLNETFWDATLFILLLLTITYSYRVQQFRMANHVYLLFKSSFSNRLA